MADRDEEQKKADPGSLDQDGDRGWTALCHLLACPVCSTRCVDLLEAILHECLAHENGGELPLTDASFRGHGGPGILRDHGGSGSHGEDV